jgi:D-alanyl-lipoteichoic acid acyltransferase DltB (MBOAT superfamily)
MMATVAERVPAAEAVSRRAEGWTGSVKALLPVAAQLILAILLVRQFQLESDAFYRMLLVATGGFVVHGLLPLKQRMPFFLLLSFAGIFVVFGFADGLWLLTAGMVLIGLCHVPIRFYLRVVLVLLAAALAAFARAGLLDVPWSGAVWPILGSMFMFRLALYMYAVRYDPTPRTVTGTLSYFFMLPNVAYPLFPVVDYVGYGKSHYAGEAGEIYERGMQWITRGLLHLLLYRFVYLYLTIPTSAIHDVGDLTRSMLATFLLYLRVSGQFHLAIGILHLFGFRLPETHKLYYLASSFTDFWRRINIYWKDFMMKLVYYPSFFRLRRYGDRTALVVATAVVFLTTWLLHSYQWFWLQGEFPLTLPDGLFWGILGVLVIMATLREMRRGRKRTLAKPKQFDAGRGLRTTLMFCTLTVLWSLWSAESIVEWVWNWSAITRGSATDVAVVVGFLAGFFLISGHSWDAPATATGQPRPLLRRPLVQSAALLVLLLLIGQPAVYERSGPQLAGVVTALRANRLNEQDTERQFLGYYEKLDDEGRLADVGRSEAPEAPNDDEWHGFVSSAAFRSRPDFVVRDIVPEQHVRFKGAMLSTNRWSMRDGDYTLAKQPGVKRIAVLGHSVTMGTGVNDDDVFEAVLERQLNAQHGAVRYEILNFSVAGHSLLQQMALLEERVFQFEPDVVILTAASPKHLEQHLLAHLTRSVLPLGIEIPFPELRAILAAQGIEKWGGDGLPVPYGALRTLSNRIGIPAVMPQVEAESRLRPVLDDIVAWLIQRAGATVREHGAVPILLGLDDVTATTSAGVPGADAARASGFVVIDMFDVYHAQPVEALRIAPWDNHPNATGHRMIADRLLVELRKHDGALQLGLPSQAVAASNPTME